MQITNCEDHVQSSQKRTNTNKLLSHTDSEIATTQQPEYRREKHRQNNRANVVIFFFFHSTSIIKSQRVHNAFKSVVLLRLFCVLHWDSWNGWREKKCLLVKLRTYYMFNWWWADPTMRAFLLIFYHWLSYHLSRIFARFSIATSGVQFFRYSCLTIGLIGVFPTFCI